VDGHGGDGVLLTGVYGSGKSSVAAAAVAGNYRRVGIRRFVLAYFVRDLAEVQGVREALGVPLRVVRLTVLLADIERRLAGDVTSGRRDDLREAAASIAADEGVGVEDVVVGNDRPVGIVARDVLAFLGWDSRR
jgi:hypothetical protein